MGPLLSIIIYHRPRRRWASESPVGVDQAEIGLGADHCLDLPLGDVIHRTERIQPLLFLGERGGIAGIADVVVRESSAS
jgi:hypothetical protein